jgi:hypothetical protein
MLQIPLGENMIVFTPYQAGSFWRKHKKFGLVIIIFFFAPVDDSLFGQQPVFGKRVDMGMIKPKAINEASGLTASRRVPGVFWTHNDSGDESRVFAINETGELLATCTLEGVDARDWEDVAIGKGPVEGESYLYVADIGDNSGDHNNSFIYRFIEPVISLSTRDLTLKSKWVDKITFQYPDGSRDAETLLADPMTGDLCIVSKRDSLSRVYRLPYPQSIDRQLTAEYLCELPLSMAVAGDVSATGEEILIKNYLEVYYWRRDPAQTIGQALLKPPTLLQYSPEPQGEAICWKWNGEGYYTLSEELFNIETRLYYYPRLATTVSIRLDAKVGEFRLWPNSPNPFNQSTTLAFAVPETSQVTLSVFDELGRQVAVLFQQTAMPGSYRVNWQAGSLASGFYLCRLQTPKTTLVQKLQLVK